MTLPLCQYLPLPLVVYDPLLLRRGGQVLPPPSQPLQPRLALVLPLTLYLLLTLSELLRDTEKEKEASDFRSW